MHREGAARGDHQLYGVADNKSVAQQETILGVLQYGTLHKLAVAVAVAGVGVLTGAAPCRGCCRQGGGNAQLQLAVCDGEHWGAQAVPMLAASCSLMRAQVRQAICGGDTFEAM